MRKQGMWAVKAITEGIVMHTDKHIKPSVNKHRGQVMEDRRAETYSNYESTLRHNFSNFRFYQKTTFKFVKGELIWFLRGDTSSTC
jgi:hypothetical protein